MSNTPDLSNCPNCDASLTNILTKQQLLDIQYVEFAKEFGDFNGDYMCTKCSKELLTKCRRSYQKTKKSTKIHIDNFISSFPILSIAPPSEWKYKPLGIVTSQYKLDSYMNSNRVFDAMLDSRKNLFDMDGITNKGERMCIEILRQKCYVLNGNAIVGIDVDYQSYGAGANLIVCMSGTAVKVDNIEEFHFPAKIAFDSFKEHLPTIDKLKRFAKQGK